MYISKQITKILMNHSGISKLKENKEISPDDSLTLCKVENLRMLTKNWGNL